MTRVGLRLGDEPDPGKARSFEQPLTGLDGRLTRQHDGTVILTAFLGDEDLREIRDGGEHHLRRLLERIERSGGGEWRLEFCFARALPREGTTGAPLDPLSERIDALAPEARWEISDWEMLDGDWRDPYRRPQEVLAGLLECELEAAPASLAAMRASEDGRKALDGLGQELYIAMTAPISDLLAVASRRPQQAAAGTP